MDRLAATLASFSTPTEEDEDMTDNGIVPVPSPPGLPLIGNIADLDPDVPLQSFLQMLDTYGEIIRVNLNGTRLVIGSVELADELCDESRFHKVVQGGLNQVRNGIGDGLFTAHGYEKNWGIAHRILLPAFGPASIRGMFPGTVHPQWRR
jgi:cytochrome P450/NADPH-cytochrome P450 reductase